MRRKLPEVYHTIEELTLLNLKVKFLVTFNSTNQINNLVLFLRF